jgi:hypothetical protein
MKIRRALLGGAIACAAMAAVVFAACGGDDDSGGGSGGGSGNDKDYVAGLCKSMVKFQDSLLSVQKKAGDVKSADDAIKLIVDPLESFVKDMEKLSPPSDLKDYHSKAVAQFKDAVDKMKKGKDPSALSGIQVPDPPKNVSDRLDKVAQANPDCKKANIDFKN